MRTIGIVSLVAGLALCAYSLVMDVGVVVPRQSMGDGFVLPPTEVANVDLMGRRQNFMVFGGILSVVGAILVGFSALARRPPPIKRAIAMPVSAAPEIINPTSVTICPKCRYMGAGDATACARCESPLPQA